MVSNWLRMQQLFVIVMFVNIAARAQTAGSNAGQGQPQPEVHESGGYIIHQSMEFGYRVSDLTGSEQMYNTLVDLRTGPRFLEQSLSMQSQNHDGVLFDNLFVNSYGWGGDPNNGLRMRMEKNKWYDFRANFRRDQEDFNYDLLANPLNPSTSSPNLPVTFSPHNFGTRRRMSDYDLTLLPQSWISFRLGYSHNNMTGPSYSSVHEGTDALLFQDWNTTLNSYRFGADVKLLPRTVLSYDQFFDYYKGDTSWQLAPFAQALLPGTAEHRRAGASHRHGQQESLRDHSASDQSDQLHGNADQHRVQCVLRLQPHGSHPYFHADRALDSTQHLLPALGVDRIVRLQFGRDGRSLE